MPLPRALARLGILKPSKTRVEGFLVCLEHALNHGDVFAFDVLKRELSAMAAVHGFLGDAVPLVSSRLHSEDRKMVTGALNAIEAIVRKHGKKLGPFTITRIVTDLLRFQKPDMQTYRAARNIFSKILDGSQSYAMYSLQRLVITGEDRLQMAVIIFLFEYVMKCRKLKKDIVKYSCRIVLEALLLPSPAICLGAFDLLYALYYRGASKTDMLNFFAEAATKDLVLAIKTRLLRTYKPPLLPWSVQGRHAPWDLDFRWAARSTQKRREDII